MEETTIPTAEAEDVLCEVRGCTERAEEGETMCAACVDLPECTNCSDRVPEGEELTHDGDVYCESCYNDTFYDCDRCGDTILRDETETACEHDDYGTYCSHCAEREREDCDSCNEDDSDELSIPSRDYSTGDLPEFMSGQAGEIITSTRIFSAELECNAPGNSALREAADELPRPFGLCYDGSLGSSGVEFQTPKLQGKAGEDAIKTITRILNAHSFTVDSRAGLHVHLDGKGLLPRTRTKSDPRALKDALTFYLAYEEVLLSFLPPSRRGNRFCDKLGKSYHVKEIRGAATLEELEKIWYRVSLRRQLIDCKERKYHDSRYNGVNLHSLLTDGHIEIRYHSGTLNATKILEWTNLHQTILDRACDNLLGTRSSLDAMAMTDLREKTESMYNVLALPERARAYFTMRQQTFTRNAEDKTEASNLDEVCAA